MLKFNTMLNGQEYVAKVWLNAYKKNKYSEYKMPIDNFRKALCKIDIHKWDKWVEFTWPESPDLKDRGCLICGKWHVKNFKTNKEQFFTTDQIMDRTTVITI